MKYEPITVTKLNQYIKSKIDTDEYLNNVLVKGEISNFKHHYTGHLYFTLKDENSLIKCIMFKSYTSHLNFVPKDGMKVKILGSVSVFERDGVYQIYCKAMQEDGLGDLYTKYLELKNKLEAEGLFDEEHKQKVPYLPKIVGVLTSQTGAVIRDIINVSTRRNPNVYIRLLPVPVQGQGAGEKIAEAIDLANKEKIADVLIIARGGGSLEDLWPFNEEVVARKVFACKTPIISGVGHQIDFTICDFVADKRAETPTGAAERAVPMLSDLLLEIDNYKTRYLNAIKRVLDNNKLRLKKLTDSYVLKNPLSMYEIKEQKLDNLIDKLSNSMNAIISNNKARLEIVKNSIIFKDPSVLYENKFKKTNHLIEKLEILNPLSSLKRGYAIVKKDDKCITSLKTIKKDDIINVTLKDGIAEAKVMEVKNG